MTKMPTECPTSTRYAIRFSNGTYSLGASCKQVPFNRAKLWRTFEHAIMHIRLKATSPLSVYLAEGEDTEVVEVIVTAKVRPLKSVKECVQEIKERAEVSGKAADAVRRTV